MYLNDEFKRLIKSQVKEWLFVYKVKVKNLNAEAVVDEYNKLIASLNRLTEYITSLMEDSEKKAKHVISKELLERLAGMSLKDIVEFCLRKEAGEYIIPYLPREKYINQVNALTVNELFYVMRILSSPTDVLWKSCFEELINKLDNVTCQDLFNYYFFETKVNIFKLLDYIKRCPNRELSNYYLNKLFSYISERLPKCKLNEVEGLLYHAKYILYDLSAFNTKLKDEFIEAIVKLLLNEKDVERIAEIMTVKPYLEVWGYMKTDDVMKIVMRILDEIYQDPLKVSAIRILYVLRTTLLWHMKEAINEQWKLNEKLKAIWYRIINTLKTTQDFIKYSKLYMKLHESVFEYYLKEYAGMKVELPALDSLRLREMLIKNLREGVPYRELSNTLLNLRRYMNRETYKRLKLSLRYYHRKLSSTGK